MKVPTSRVVVGPLSSQARFYGHKYLHLLPRSESVTTHCGCEWSDKRSLGKRHRWRRPRPGDEDLPLCEDCRQVESSIQHHDREVARAMAKVGFS